MQTHEWEALLDGTTPGGWGRGADPREIYAVDDAGRAVFVGSTYAHNAHSGADADLFASAPAAVAEVIRLRKAIEAMRDEYRRNAYLDSWLSQFSTVPLIPVFNDLADALARILEGDNDE